MIQYCWTVTHFLLAGYISITNSKFVNSIDTSSSNFWLKTWFWSLQTSCDNFSCNKSNLNDLGNECEILGARLCYMKTMYLRLKTSHSTDKFSVLFAVYAWRSSTRSLSSSSVFSSRESALVEFLKDVWKYLARCGVESCDRAIERLFNNGLMLCSVQSNVFVIVECTCNNTSSIQMSMLYALLMVWI